MYIEKELLNTSIKKINQSYHKQENFSFREIRKTESLEIIKRLPKQKATVLKDIPIRIIKNVAHVYSHRVKIIFNNCTKNKKFLDILKHTGITPVFKKGDTADKSYYRPINTLSNFWKIFETYL